MEMQRDNNADKRRRKPISRPVLVRSVKPGGAISATYSTGNNPSRPSLWRAA
jgi:hypothetical protein